MLEQLQTIQLPQCKNIQLRFRYRIDNSNVKILTLLLSNDIKHSGQATVYDLLMSVKQEILMRFMVIQHESVNWETVSITYPSSRFGTKQDILKLPLQNFIGLIKNSKIDPYELSVLHISLRFPGRPLPKQIKIHGVYSNQTQEFEDLAQNCANAYVERFTIPGTGITYRLQFTVLVNEKSQKTTAQNKAKKKKVIRKASQYIEAKMCFWRLDR